MGDVDSYFRMGVFGWRRQALGRAEVPQDLYCDAFGGRDGRVSPALAAHATQRGVKEAARKHDYQDWSLCGTLGFRGRVPDAPAPRGCCKRPDAANSAAVPYAPRRFGTRDLLAGRQIPALGTRLPGCGAAGRNCQKPCLYKQAAKPREKVNN